MMVDYKVTVCKSRKEWLEARKGGLGASDAGAYMGVSPWKSNEQLWKEKCGIVEPEDISDTITLESKERTWPLSMRK